MSLNEWRTDPAEPRYLQQPVARLSDEREAHGSFGHRQLAALVARRRPPELPELLRHDQQQRHGHEARRQGGQRRDQVEGVEDHGEGRPVCPGAAME